MTDNDWRDVSASLVSRLGDYERRVSVRSAGKVQYVGDGVVHIDGLAECKNGELIEFENGGFAIAMNLEEKMVCAVSLGSEDAMNVSVGETAYGTGSVLTVPCGEGLLGHVVDPLGMPLDGAEHLSHAEMRPIEAPAPGILQRKPVSKPLQTGLMAIDAMVPIGRGQRELIIGDRQTGKTSIAVDTILNQKDTNVACIYVAIGQKASSVAQLITQLRKAGAMEYTTVVSATAATSATMQYIAPYAGCAMAEWFMLHGRDVLIVYDDLSKHAVAYRSMSLLLKHPPGREAYPGDVFYLHSRLLERAASLSDEMGGGSMTALPIIETQAGDISAYIPTNVISITDGQIFLDTEMFREGVRPAVSGGLSVSRVGGAAQAKCMRRVAGKLRLELAQYRELQVFAQFASDMDAATQDKLRYGQLLTELCRQRNNAPMPLGMQVIFLYAATRGLLPHTLTQKDIEAFKAEFPKFIFDNYNKVLRSLNVTGDITPNNEQRITEAVAAWLSGHNPALLKDGDEPDKGSEEQAAKGEYPESEKTEPMTSGTTAGIGKVTPLKKPETPAAQETAPEAEAPDKHA